MPHLAENIDLSFTLNYYAPRFSAVITHRSSQPALFNPLRQLIAKPQEKISCENISFPY